MTIEKPASMRNIISLFPIMIILLFFSSCGDPGKENGNILPPASSQLPPDRNLVPWSIKADDVVNPANMLQSYREWTFRWSRDTAAVIAWLGGGMEGHPAKRFKVPGDSTEVLAVTFAMGAEESFMKNAKTEYVILRGLAMEGNNILILDLARYAGAYENDLPPAADLDPKNIGTGGPYNAADILRGMQAWKGKVVTIHGEAELSQSKDEFKFMSNRSAILIQMKEKVTNVEIGKSFRKVSGAVSEYDGRNQTLILTEGVLVE